MRDPAPLGVSSFNSERWTADVLCGIRGSCHASRWGVGNSGHTLVSERVLLQMRKEDVKKLTDARLQEDGRRKRVCMVSLLTTLY